MPRNYQQNISGILDLDDFLIFTLFSGSAAVTNVSPVHDFYIQPPPAPPVPAFHHTNSFLPGSLPPFPQDLAKSSSFTLGLRPPMPNPMDQLSLRVSPVCNSQGSSPHASLNAQETRIHSTVDQSSASEHSDDEDIDVVRSAFIPIKPANVLLQEIQHPDSTVQDKEPGKVKCELKAPSSRTLKNLSLSPQNTKIRVSPSGSANKSVWRPY